MNPAQTDQDIQLLKSRVDRAERASSDADQTDVVIEYPRRLMLRSPNGHFWAIGVDNAGALTTTDMGTSL